MFAEPPGLENKDSRFSVCKATFFFPPFCRGKMKSLMIANLVSISGFL